MTDSSSASSSTPTSAAIPAGIITAITWAGVAISCVLQKTHADSLIADSFDISAVQIQQLNGSVTSHVLVAIAVGLAVSVVCAFWVAGSHGRIQAETLAALRAQGSAVPVVPSDRSASGAPMAPPVRPLVVPPPPPAGPGPADGPGSWG